MKIGVLQIAEKELFLGEWCRYSCYIHEILNHAGLPHKPILTAELELALGDLGVLIIPNHFFFNDQEKVMLDKFVEGGGVLIGLAGPSNLEGIFGCKIKGSVNEAWMKPCSSTNPIVNQIRIALHSFGGQVLEPIAPDVTVLAEWLEPDEWIEDHFEAYQPWGAAIAVRRYGKGWTLLIGADLVYSVLRIQQGSSVHVDGKPAVDGSAPIDEGILKVDDGFVLDYDRDRQLVAGIKVFGCPIADEWREILIRSILWGANRIRLCLPVLWYWPRNIKAIGQINHDSDGNSPAHAWELLSLMQELEIPSTWCIEYPGGYSPDFYRKLKEDGFEIALHFNALIDRGNYRWTKDSLKQQLSWLRDMAGAEVFSNKNHYLRWEGLTEFFIWLEEIGVQSDQSKGPTKQGLGGFLFGGSHPWFPMEEHKLRLIDVLEINHHAWEMPTRWPIEFGMHIIDETYNKGGVANFLFHPANLRAPGVNDGLRAIVNYGKNKGLEWWTNHQIQSWERDRRKVTFRIDKNGEWLVSSMVVMSEATLLYFDPNSTSNDTVYGFPVSRVVCDLNPGDWISCANGDRSQKRVEGDA